MGHGWHCQRGRAEAGLGPRGGVPRPLVGNHERSGLAWACGECLRGLGALESPVGACGQALTQGSRVGASGTVQPGLSADLRLATPRRLASLCSWAAVSNSGLVSGSGGSSTPSGTSWHRF